MAERRTLAPVAALGLAGAGLAAVAGSEAWVTASSCDQALTALGTGVGEAPAATAVSLALLASWGALLVTRGVVRRALSFLTALLALGLVAAVLLGVGAAADGLTERFSDLGVACSETSRTGWFWVAVVALPLAVLPALLAVRLVPTWPEMGRRYDAPAEQPTEPEQPPEERENLDLWKAMDEGRDPTA